MFVIFLIALTFSQGLTLVSYGRDFITAFPENFGYFYPFASSRYLKVTSLYDDTSFTVFYNNNTQKTSTLQKGATIIVTFPKTAEIYQLNYSTNSIRIVSTKDIIVHSMSKIDDNQKQSVQANVVQPTPNLGMFYVIPRLNQTGFIQTFTGSVPTLQSPRYSSFKLIIINAEDTENIITIVKNIPDGIQTEETFKLLSYQLIQLEANAPMRMVKSSHKVAVLLTHPCLEKRDCKCSLIVNQILPQQFQGQNFVVPSIPGTTQSWLLMTSNDTASSLSQNNVQLQPSPSGLMSHLNQTKFQYVTASGNVSLRLIGPGFVIELIPENMFAACYMLQWHSFENRKALVIAETDSRNALRKQSNQETGAQWTEITGTKYSSAIVTLTEPTVIWHPTSMIAVYVLEVTGPAVYGGPALPISDKPDEFGCAIIPGKFEVGNEPYSWTGSLDYCSNIQKQFACPTKKDMQVMLASNVNTTEDEEGWIGLRRSLMTNDWYWQRQSTTSSSPVNYTHWADGQPLDELQGFCASLSLDSQDDFEWKSAKCCEKKLPVCYIPPLYLNSFYFLSTVDIS